MSRENRCYFCGYTVVWVEGSGWLRHMLGTILWGTESCPSRKANPAAGHALDDSASADSSNGDDRG